MNESFVPIDAEARKTLQTDLVSNFFVNAGAGSGKTSNMVQRICALVDIGVSITGIAAITFTEKAAAELRNRIRKELSKSSSDRRLQAIVELDAAPIGTIHSFAGRLLRENPISAQVPPLLDIQDELGSQIAFTDRWNRICETLFADEQAHAALDYLIFHGVTLDHIEQVARQLDQSWDRIQTAEIRAARSFEPFDGEKAVEILENYALMWNLFPGSAEDSLVTKLQNLERWCVDARQLISVIKQGAEDGNKIFQQFASLPWPAKNLGNKSWGEHQDSVRQARLDVEAKVLEIFNSHTQAAIDVVIDVISTLILDGARSRRLTGRLEFADLLILARDMLTDPTQIETRKLIQDRYPVLMIDEFQDTDPVQAEIAILIAESIETQQLKPGALFTVGDPKQSIYRFRRADIKTFIETKQILDSEILLTTNFRSDPQVLDWINAVFNDVITDEGLRQLPYVALSPSNKKALSAASDGPAVIALGSNSQPWESATEAREAEARDVAQTILTATGRENNQTAWTHQERGHAPRPMTLSDVCILIPSRTSLPSLESALSAFGIEYTAEASSLVYSDPDIQSLLTTLKAIANTADEASLVLALRSPLFGCSDADLLEWSAARGSWNLLGRDIKTDSQFRAARSMAFLRELLDSLPSTTPADLLERLITTKSFLEQQLEFTPRTREKFRRIRFIVDQAQAWHERTHGSLRDYLMWTDLQAEDDARVKEPMIPESGFDAVRIMTIHASKGLEFPMVIVSGASGIPKSGSPSVLWDGDNKIHIKLRGAPNAETKARVGSRPIQSIGFEKAAEIEKSFGLAEKKRLLYVACTRAESHLVISVHQQKRTEKDNPSLAEILRSTEKAIELAATYELRENDAWLPAPVAQIPAGTGLSFEDWSALRDDWSARSERPASFSITSLAKHPETAPVSNPFETDSAFSYSGSESKEKQFVKGTGRAGKKPAVQFLSEEELNEQRAQEAEAARDEALADEAERNLGGKHIGTAVHRTLELSNLSAEADVDGIARAICAEAGIANWHRVADLSRSALATPILVAANKSEHWLELPMTMEHQGIVLEGVADLVYRNADGELVVVDFKTDMSVDQERLNSYWRQLSAYANLISLATGEMVRSINLLMCAESPAVVLTRSIDSEN